MKAKVKLKIYKLLFPLFKDYDKTPIPISKIKKSIYNKFDVYNDGFNKKHDSKIAETMIERKIAFTIRMIYLILVILFFLFLLLGLIYFKKFSF